MTRDFYTEVNQKSEQLFEGVDLSDEALEAMEIQERIFERYIRETTIKTISANILAGVFALMGFALVMYGPEDRTTAIIIFSILFVLLSAVIAGFSQFTLWRGLGLDFEAAQLVASKAVSAATRWKRSSSPQAPDQTRPVATC